MGTKRARAAAGALALATLVFGSGAGAATGTLPDLGPTTVVGSLPAGGTVIVHPSVGSPVAAIELWYRAPSIGFDTKAQTGVARLAAQAVAASRPIVGDSLGRVVEGAGGRLSISVYGDSVAITATVPATAAQSVVKTMTTAYFAPVISPEGFLTAQRDVVSEAFVASVDPETVVRDAVFADLFASGPQHYPALGDPKSIGALTEGQVRAFATRAFRAGNATLVVTGAVDASVIKAAALGRPGDSPAEISVNPEVATVVAPVVRAAQPSGGGYGWVGPSIADEREATAMDFIADYLFRPDDGVVTREIADKYPDAFFAGQFITLHDPGVMFVAFSGGDDAAIRGYIDSAIASMRQPLDSHVFAGALASFKYHIFSDLQTPTQIADVFGWYAVEGAPDYAPGARGDGGPYARAADSLTPEFVAQIAQEYLDSKDANITLAQPGVAPAAAPQADASAVPSPSPSAGSH
jgi:predicted Zn-dependent peptidase